MADFQQMGGVPEGYGDLLGAAQRQLVLLPDGTYTVAPSRGQATSVDEIYANILPKSEAAPLTARKVQTVRIDPETNQRIETADAPKSRDDIWFTSKPPTGPVLQSAPTTLLDRPGFAGLPVIGPLATGVASALTLADTLGKRGTAVAKPQPQPTKLPSSAQPKGYNTLTGEYEPMLPSTPYLAKPAPVRIADNKAQARLLPIANAPSLAETLQEQALLRQRLQPASRPRLPMAQPIAMAAARMPSLRSVAPVRQNMPVARALSPVQVAPVQQNAAQVIARALSGGHNTSSPAAFAADVTRPSNMPGVETFSGTVQQGQAGQNRYGSTARNELLALYT